MCQSPINIPCSQIYTIYIGGSELEPKFTIGSFYPYAQNLMIKT